MQRDMQRDIHRRQVITKREQTWIHTPDADMAHERLTDLVDPTRRHRTNSVSVIAESNSGKTRLVKRFLKLNAPREGAEGLHIPVIYLSMADIRRVEDLSVELLQSIQAPDPSSGTHTARKARFQYLQAQVGLKMILLDEFHDCVTTSGRGVPFLRMIKWVMANDVYVVPIGVEALSDVLQMDAQFSTRFSSCRLGRLEDPGMILTVLTATSNVSEDDITDEAIAYILQETKGVLGHVLDLAEGALVNGRDLSLPSLRQARKYMDVLDHLR